MTSSPPEYRGTDSDDATEVAKMASLAPQTVTDAPMHAAAWEAARRAPTARSRYRFGPVETRQLNPEAWKTALALAEGDARRIEIHDDDETFIVHNHRVK